MLRPASLLKTVLCGSFAEGNSKTKARSRRDRIQIQDRAACVFPAQRSSPVTGTGSVPDHKTRGRRARRHAHAPGNSRNRPARHRPCIWQRSRRPGDEIGAAELAVAHRFNPPVVDAGHLLPDLGRSYTRSPSSGCDDPMLAQSAVRAAPVDIQSASCRSDANSRPK
jgi:hypothetical protein